MRQQLKRLLRQDVRRQRRHWERQWKAAKWSIAGPQDAINRRRSVSMNELITADIKAKGA